ncbi:MAG: DUF4384 domain-containing protein [Thermodesulfobacteriota bacterium]
MKTKAAYALTLCALLLCVLGCASDAACSEDGRPRMMAPVPSKQSGKIPVKPAPPSVPSHSITGEFRSKLSNPARPFRVAIHTADSRLTVKIGEPVCFVVSAERDCYVYVWDVGTDGKPRLLFPNRWQPSHKLTKGVPCRIPDQGGQVHCVVEGPPGTNYVKAVATLQPIKSISEQVASLTLGLPVSNDPASIWTKIRQELERMDPASWSEGELALEVVK